MLYKIYCIFYENDIIIYIKRHPNSLIMLIDFFYYCDIMYFEMNIVDIQRCIVVEFVRSFSSDIIFCEQIFNTYESGVISSEFNFF